MKKAKVLLLSAISAMSLLFLGGCNTAKFKVGICQLAQHEALDAATKGFKDALKEELGSQVAFDEQVANGESATCSTIVNSFVSKKVDLIMANATPALQAAFNATDTIPILGTSITEYGVALGLENFSGVTEVNVSGTSDLAPLKEQATMVKDLFPDAHKVGLLFCSAEANSLYQVQVVEQELQAKGFTTERIAFSDSNDMAVTLTAKAPSLDVLYVPTDNTCADNATTIDAICETNHLPVFAGEENLCKKCGVVTLSISYYNIGLKTGKMAAEILKGEKKVSEMPIAYDENPVKKFNRTICERLGMTPPSGYEEIK